MVLQLRLPVTQPVDVEIVKRAAKRLAVDADFAPQQIDDIVVVVSELATNLLRHAIEGSIAISLIDDTGRSQMRVESRDAGPGIADIDLALQDGYSTSGTLGCGLPIVRRLTDQLEIDSGPSGTLIVACKWMSTQSK